MVVLWERKELIIFCLKMLLVGHLPGTHTSCSNAHVSSGEQGISCGRVGGVKGQPGIWRQHLCFLRPLCKEGLMAATCLQLRDQILSFSVRDTRKAHVCVVKQVGFAPLGDPFGKANLMRSRTGGDVSVRAKFPDSGDPLCSEDDGRKEHFEDREQTTGWTATLDARGTPLLIEALRGAVPLDDEGEESDLQIEADEEFEYGSWAPSLSSVPHDRVDDSLNTVCEEEIHHWRDGEMESELGRLEMAVCDGTYDGRVPTLLQMNRAMHLCCKAVYKGLGQAGLSKGLRVLNLMWMCGVTPNGRSFDLLLDAAIGSAAQGNKDALYVALTIIFNMCDLGLAPRVILVNQLIKQVLKATANRESDYALALEVVDAVNAAGVRLDIYSYNSLMAATAMQPKSGSQQVGRLNYSLLVLKYLTLGTKISAKSRRWICWHACADTRSSPTSSPTMPSCIRVPRAATFTVNGWCGGRGGCWRCCAHGHAASTFPLFHTMLLCIRVLARLLLRQRIRCTTRCMYRGQQMLRRNWLPCMLAGGYSRI